MRRIALTLGLIAVLATGCGRSSRDTALYQKTGRQKAIVSVLPVIDHSGCDMYKWSLSRELTAEIRKRTDESASLYLLRDGGSLELAEELNTPNPSELLPHNFGPTEYAVVAELLDQNQTNLGRSRATNGNAGAVINVAMRLRVLDLRGDQPKVILQEMIDHEHLVARAYLNTDYDRNHWGTDAFASTPCGIAHTHLVRDLVSRVEGYIEANR